MLIPDVGGSQPGHHRVRTSARGNVNQYSMLCALPPSSWMMYHYVGLWRYTPSRISSYRAHETKALGRERMLFAPSLVITDYQMD